MPSQRFLRILAALFLAVSATWVSAGAAAALEPYRPLPGYHPKFVTETDVRPWKDCLWASGAMLLDKWTNGRIRVTHQKLRDLSGDAHGGSSFDELTIAYDKLGIHLEFSPDGGAPITWAGLLARLKRGAGAVLLGDDSKLPRYFGRWDYGFWKAKGKKDNHAVYVERYDSRHARVWLMDPLARGKHWKGEWIPVAALRKFVWKQGPYVVAAVTPTAKRAPFAGVRLAAPQVSTSADAVTATWSAKTPRHWRLPKVKVSAKFTAATDPLAAAIDALQVSFVPTAAKAPSRPTLRHPKGAITLTAPLPADPGAYEAKLSFRDRRFGRTVALADSVAVFVPGPRRASVKLDNPVGATIAGEPVSVSLKVANTGDLAWTERPPGAGGLTDGDTGRPVDVRGTRIVAYWIPIALERAADGSLPKPVSVEPVPVRAAPLAPGHVIRMRAKLVAPPQPGSWALVVDVVDDVDGSFAALGSRPGALILDVVSNLETDGLRSRVADELASADGPG